METVFALHLESDLDEVQTQAILKIVYQIGMGDWLAQNPFTELQFLSSVYMEINGFHIEVSGFYSYQQRSAEIGVSRDSSEFGRAFYWGQIEKMSQVAKNFQQSIQITLLHELGHHLHAELKELGSSEFGVALRLPRSDACSLYAKSLRPVEYFAETFVAWVLYRNQLAKNDPLGYAMIDRSLGFLGLEVGTHEFDS